MSKIAKKFYSISFDIGKCSVIEASELVKAFLNDNYALVRADYAERVKEQQTR